MKDEHLKMIAQIKELKTLLLCICFFANLAENSGISKASSIESLLYLPSLKKLKLLSIEAFSFYYFSTTEDHFMAEQYLKLLDEKGVKVTVTDVHSQPAVYKWDAPNFAFHK